MAELKLPPPVAWRWKSPTRSAWILQEHRQTDLPADWPQESLYNGAAVLRAVAAWMRANAPRQQGGWYCAARLEMADELSAAADKIGCQHECLNDHEDACLDCGAVFVDGKWQ